MNKKKRAVAAMSDTRRTRREKIRNYLIGRAFIGTVIVALIVILLMLIGRCANSGNQPWPGSGSGTGSAGTSTSDGETTVSTPTPTPPVDPTTATGRGDTTLSFVSVRFVPHPANPQRHRPYYAEIFFPDGQKVAAQGTNDREFLSALGEMMKGVRELYPDKMVYLESFQNRSGEETLTTETRNEIKKRICEVAHYSDDQVEWYTTRQLQRLLTQE